MSPAPHEINAFRDWFGVRPSAARILAVLYAADGKIIRHADLMSAGGQTQAGTRTSVRDLRAAMDPGSIGCAHGTGFWLTQVGLADCAAALADARRRAA